PQDAALQDIAEYLLCSLMGNSVPTQSLNLKQDCVMISRTVLQDIISDPLFHIHDAPIETIGEEMNRKGYSLWLAVEVLCYPAPFSDNRAVKKLSPHVVDAPPTVCRSITDESCQKAEEFITQALALRKEKNYRAAIEYLERAKKLFEVKGDVRSPRDDQLSCEKKDPPQKHERTHVEHIRILYEEARFSKHRKDYHNAIEILEKAKAYIATNIPGGATMEQEKVVELQFDIYQQLGECYTHTGDIEKAREHFLVAQRLKPKSELPLVGLAIAIMQENRFNEAERLFRDALELNRHSDKALAGLGLVLQRAGNPEESLAMYRKAMESNPTNLTALMGLVQTAYATNQLNIAIDYMKEYLLHFPANTEILYCLAGTYYKQEDYDKCREVLEQIFIFNPSHAEARNLLTMLDHVQGYTYAQCRTA
ncbi:MAG: tetratricopeptide repeat protein, partial [Desulfobacterota bacterium]|nr:tetratricopeptide repeat protein [Thermodesulfobacteriota bacterium]